MAKLHTAVFGGGCFWCTEAVFQRLKGVISVTSGYAGGKMDKPTYEQVSTGSTGHAEVIKVEYDPDVIQYEDLLNVFFASHDPTSLNKQGNDVGTQYRSVIFYTDQEQMLQAKNFIRHLTETKVFGQPIVTEIKELANFYPAERYHQNFYNSNQNYPYCTFVINPKVAKLKEKFAKFLKEDYGS